VADKDPVRGVGEWAWRTALLILGAAIALSVAVELLKAIWPTLAIIATIATVCFGAWRWWRWHQNRW
jgi:hypothetical protein